MAGAVHINWYATGFRGDRLEAALAELTPLCLRYGATEYRVYRSRDDRYRFRQYMHFEEKIDWERFWYGAEFTEFRTETSGWWQVPVVYEWQDVVSTGALDAEAAAPVAEAGGS